MAMSSSQKMLEFRSWIAGASPDQISARINAGQLGYHEEAYARKELARRHAVEAGIEKHEDRILRRREVTAIERTNVIATVALCIAIVSAGISFAAAIIAASS